MDNHLIQESELVKLCRYLQTKYSELEDVAKNISDNFNSPTCMASSMESFTKELNSIASHKERLMQLQQSFIAKSFSPSIELKTANRDLMTSIESLMKRIDELYERANKARIRLAPQMGQEIRAMEMIDAYSE